ncbi:MAG: YbaK/EbsC family protein [Desulfofustis sp.]|jgi:prolyl-tRNA editing enzyme YbaK/EbsC (Cys-tRNA(Pro) deacylase)|nr:YbaK/EbsC family protein [Desulfofustis sp.]
MNNTKSLHPSARKVQEFITSRGYSWTVRELSVSTRTAQDAAAALGIAIERIAKSLVFRSRTDNLPVLVIASGGNRVDLEKIKQQTGMILSKGDATFVKQETGFPIGGVPPAGHCRRLATILDQDLKQYPTIWAAAGTSHALFELEPDQLACLTEGTWLDLSESA